MGINAILTPEDLMKTEPAQPGWYPAVILNYNEEVTRGSAEKPSDGSMNAIFEFEILDGPPNVKGRKFKRYFNEKVLFFGKNLWVTLFPDFDKKGGGALTSDKLRSAVGQKLMVYVGKDTKTGYDSILDYKPL